MPPHSMARQTGMQSERSDCFNSDHNHIAPSFRRSIAAKYRELKITGKLSVVREP